MFGLQADEFRSWVLLLRSDAVAACAECLLYCTMLLKNITCINISALIIA